MLIKRLRLISVAFLLMISLLSFGQKSGLINSGELLSDGIKLNDQKKYKEAIAVFKKISRSDTNYSKALHELAYSAYNDSNFKATIQYAEEGLRRFPHEAANWYNLLANAYDDLGDHQKALEFYDKVIADDKNNFQGLFNKGITLYRMDKYEDAKKCFQQCLVINPYQTSAHYFLGSIALEEGRIPEAMMSYAANLIIDPSNRYVGRSIQALGGIGQMNDEVAKKAAKRKPSKTDDFDMVQEIVVNRIAMDKKYKLKTSLEDPIVRQLQVMLEKLEYNAADKGFWMQYYVPFYTRLFAEDQFEPFVYHIFSRLDIKPIVSYVKKNEKRINNFTSFAADYFTDIRATQTLEPEKRNAVKQKYYYTTRLIGKGESQEKGKDVVLTGPWEFYHTNGKVKSKGSFNENQERTGWWEDYHDNGQLKEKTNYLNGKAQGKSQNWYDNGVLASEGTYKNGEADGEWNYYYYNGLPRKTVHFRGGQLNGPVKAYTAYATLSFSLNYRDDKEYGEEVYYYNNGKVETSTMYADGEANGKYKKYYYSGQLMEEGTFEKNKKSGLWKEYHENGKLSGEVVYIENELDGEHKQYYDNGQLLNKTVYRKGKVDGKMEDYDEDGKLFSDSYYEKGRLKDIKFYDKTGKVISSATSRNGSANLTFYDPNGNKTSEGYFTKEGMRSGKTTYYYKNGKPSVMAEYKEGLLNGNRIGYYKNGKISEEGNYTNDVEDGYHISYHLSGKTETEGWISEGKKQGEHVSYTDLGDLSSRTYYLNDDEDGYTEYYHPNGKLDYDQRFEEGWVKEIVQYDTTGKVLSTTLLPQGNSDFEFKLYNGKTYIKGSYKNNFLHGEYKVLYPDGSPSSIQYYRWGYKDSIYKSFYFGGKLATEGKYTMSNKQGLWKYYYPNGNLEYTEFFVNGSQEDKFIMYNEDGTIDKDGQYKNNQLHGPFKIFGENNQLAVQLNYVHGKFVSYTYEGKDGKPVPDIAIANGTGSVTAYYKNGNKSAEMQFMEDEQNGVRKIYFTNGKLYIEGNRLDGYDHGSKKVYYLNGQVEKEENYWYGSLHGTVKSYYPNGKIKTEEHYHNGELNGDCKYYDANGKVQVRTYFYGVMQSVK